jgi:hypothetical protein
MEEVVLIFPTLGDMTRFLIDNNISHAEVNARETRLRMIAKDKVIQLACGKYNAYAMTPFHQFPD